MPSGQTSSPISASGRPTPPATALGPNDIARRAFTPSADGYHKAEVREFLDRVARQLRQMAAAGASVPGVASVAGTNVAADSGIDSERLTAIENQLAAVSRQLDQVLSLVTRQGAPQQTPSVPTAPLPPSPPAPAAPAPSASVPSAPAPAAPTPQVHIEAPLSTAPTAPQLPRVGAPEPPVAAAAPADVDALFASTDPVISDTANDLLDGVLDDVMGRLSKPPST